MHQGSKLGVSVAMRHGSVGALEIGDIPLLKSI